MRKNRIKVYKRHKLIDFIGVFCLICVLLFVWQLYRGPIAIPFLKPYIIKALNHDDADYQVTLDSVNLEFVRSIKPLRIIANNVVYRRTDDEVVVNAPKTSVSFSIKALLQGIIAPSAVEVINPTIYIFTSYGVDKEKQHDEINQKKLAYYFDYIDDFLERFNSEDNSYPESFINDIDIRGAEVEFHEVDLGRKWVLSDVNYRFDRNLASLETEANALVKFNESDVLSSLGVEAIYRPLSDKLALRFYFSDVIPENLIGLFDAQNQKTGAFEVAVPLHGQIETLININKVAKNRNNLLKSIDEAIEKIQFEFEGGKGYVAFSDKESDNFNISSLMLKGNISGGLDKINIENTVLNMDGQEASVDINASGLKDYILKSSLEKLRLSVNVGVDELAVDDLFHYWPRYISEAAWDWCKESMSGGTLSNASFVFDFGYDKKLKSVAFQDLSGSAEVSGASLDYLTGMPKITGINGKADFYSDKIIVNLNKGVSGDVVLSNGYVELYDLNKDDNFAKISLHAVGSITDILKLIDHQPLGYTSDMGINPETIKGSAATDLSLEFELKQDLTPDDVKVGIISVLQDVVLQKIVSDKDIEAKKLDLHITNEGMLLTGVTSFEGIPVNLLWDENFKKRAYNSRYQMSFNFDSNLKEKLGLNFAALNAPYIKGAIPTKAVITTYPEDRTEVDITANLRPAGIDYSFLGFKKKSGVDGTAEVKLIFNKDKELQVPSFMFSKPDFNLKGKVSLDKNKNVKSINISSIKGPKTSASAQIDFLTSPEEKIKITVSGNSYNLSDFFERDEDDVRAAKERRKKLRGQKAPENEDDDWEKSKTADINIAVNNLWTNNNVAIHNFAGNAKIVHGKGIEEIHMIGNFPSSKRNKNKKAQPSRLKLDYTPRPGNEHVLAIESNDAGSTMKFLRLYDNMRGGTLTINARRDEDKRIVGHAKIRDCNIYNTPVLAKLLTVASFTGMLDLLSGDGIAFSHFDAPFEYRNNELKVTDAKAFGNVMGITGSGTYDTRLQEFDFKGLIAPAYGLNTFLGSIPIVGNLLSGKDGTVFAVNYTITGDIDDPNVDINPLSALSPNSVKDLFDDSNEKR